MPTTAAILAGDARARRLGAAALLMLYAALLWPALAGGAHGGWPLVVTELLVLAGLLAWALGMADAGQLEWSPTVLDKPLALLFALVLLQLVIGNGPLRAWALAPPAAGPATFPTRFLSLGTVSPAQTARSLLLFLAYAGVYLLVVNLVRQRQQLDRLVRVLLTAGAVLAFFSIVDYLLRESWIFRWRVGPAAPRLTGPFVNPDHWASWLVMLICLGVGHLAGRRGWEHERVPDEIVSSPRAREGAVRRSLPLLGLMLIALAAVLTLSRGAFLSVLAAGVLLLASLARVRGRTWTLALAGALGMVTVGYALWIGADPLLSRLTSEQVGRLEQWRSSIPMLATFPVLGVGLGAYKDIYFRFQPVALLPGRVYFPYAHSDLLQFAIETGPAGVTIGLWAAWRVARDLVGAHLLGRGRCPVGVGAQTRRSDPFSLGIMLGALAAVVALGAHSAVDFSARIPADGILGAACLGIATVAAHTRFGIDGARPLVDLRRVSLGGGLRPRAAVGALVALLGACSIPVIVKQARADTVTAAGPELRMEAARQLWTARLAAPGGDPRAAEARSLGDGAAAQVRRDIAATPSDPYLHERLGWVLDLQAAMHPARALPLREAALSHMQRAVALQPDSALLRRSLTALLLAPPAPRLDQAIEAGRASAERDPALLGSLVEMLAPFTPSDQQWTALAPRNPVDRADLARELEARGFLREARVLYERAVEGASPGDATVIRWMLAQLLLGVPRPADALAQAEAALVLSPGNPELLLSRARALDMARAPARLDAYYEAAASGLTRRGAVFSPESQRLQSVANDRLGDAARVIPARYRAALAQRLTDERQWAQAREEWEHLEAERLLDGAGEFSLGLAREATGDSDGALEAFRRAVAREPARASAHAHLASQLWSREQYMQAIAEWQTAAGQQPDNVETALALARAYLKVGDRVHALAEYRRVLGLAPGLPEAKQAVARLEPKP